MLRQTGRYRTLERDLMELQERKLFEYFIVVALHKAKAGVPYLPEVTQQFPLKVREEGRWGGGEAGGVKKMERPQSHSPRCPPPVQLERSFKFMRETEDQLKVIPQFCFPDAKDWAPVDSFPRWATRAAPLVPSLIGAYDGGGTDSQSEATAPPPMEDERKKGVGGVTS